MTRLRSVLGRGVVLLAVLVLVACGSSTTDPLAGGGDPAGGPGGAGDPSDPGGGGEPCTPMVLPWLAQGNFWNVAWSWIEHEASWWSGTEYGDYDAGSYTMKLGPSFEVDDKTMYEVQVSGQIDDFAPLWSHVGSDGCGNVFGMTTPTGVPTLIFSEADDEWTGTGFWTDFQPPFATVSVTRNASMTPSQYTEALDYFAPPLTAVGASETESNYDPGGCEYFPGYGTICTESSSGPASGRHHFEYWDADAGPVGMHYAQDYEDCLGVACEEEHVERRIEVWFFGDVSSDPLVFEDEPDTYAEPTPFPLSEELLVMTGAISELDTPSGYLPGYDAGAAMDLAAGIHDWFGFEITAETAGRTVDFILAWNDAVDLGFHLFAAPDHPTAGFAYLADSDDFPEWEETEHARFFSGQFQAGTYLLGVVRNSATEIESRYGILGVMDDGAPLLGAPLDESFLEGAPSAELLRDPRLRDGLREAGARGGLSRALRGGA